MSLPPADPDGPDILCVEDDPADAKLIERTLRKEMPGVRVKRVGDREAFLAALTQERFDLILSDYTIPGFSGLSALELARRHRPEVPYVFFSGTIGEERAVEAFKRGATDYVLKDRPGRLVSAVRRALDEKQSAADAGPALRIEDLANGIGHRFNNALTGVLLGIHLLRENVTEPRPQKILNLVEASARACADLISALQNLAQDGRSDQIERFFDEVDQQIAHAAQALTAPTNDGDGAGRGAPGSERRPTILVVDDDHAIRMLAKALLESRGYRVLLANNGADAFAAYHAARPGIKAILTDVTMPLMSGPELIRAVRALDPELPFVVMSGLEGPPSLAPEGGELVFLSKPMTKRDLLNAVGKVLGVAEA